MWRVFRAVLGTPRAGAFVGRNTSNHKEKLACGAGRETSSSRCTRRGRRDDRRKEGRARSPGHTALDGSAGLLCPQGSSPCCALKLRCCSETASKGPPTHVSVQGSSDRVVSPRQEEASREPASRDPGPQRALQASARRGSAGWGQANLIHAAKTRGHGAASGSWRRKKRKCCSLGTIDSRIQNIRERSLPLSAHSVCGVIRAGFCVAGTWGDAACPQAGGPTSTRTP